MHNLPRIKDPTYFIQQMLIDHLHILGFVVGLGEKKGPNPFLGATAYWKMKDQEKAYKGKIWMPGGE